jgi:transcriptional regulator with XRE-family HTH domain
MTQSRIDDAVRLRSAIKLWRATRKLQGLPYSQADLGVMVGGIRQSAVSQYAKGTIALSPRSLEAFASALGVAPESISPTLARQITAARNSRHHLSGIPAPGMVYAWQEVADLLSQRRLESLPDIFSVEMPSQFFGGVVAAGDIVVLSRIDAPKAGDGAIIQHENGQVEPCIFRPGRGGGYFAIGADGAVLAKGPDKIDHLFTVIGMPAFRWSRIQR